MGAGAVIPPSHFLSCHSAPSPDRAAQATRALETASREGLCRTHAFCAMPTGLSALLTCRAAEVPALRARVRSVVGAVTTVWPVSGLLQPRLLVSHVDAEPVRAAVARDPRTYSFGSLGLRQAGNGPWLEDSWLAAATARAGSYFAAFPALPRPRATAALIAQAVRAGGLHASLEGFLDGDLRSAAGALKHALEHPDPVLPPVLPASTVRHACSGRDEGVILLRGLGGESARAIADQLGFPLETLRHRIERAVRQFDARPADLVAVTAKACELVSAFYARWNPGPAPEIQRLEAFGIAARRPATRGISA